MLVGDEGALLHPSAALLERRGRRLGKDALHRWQWGFAKDLPMLFRALTVSALAMTVASCCAKPPATSTSTTTAKSRDVCALVSGGAEGGLPRLYRMANAHARTLGPAKNLCQVPLGERDIADQCEAVDDLSALLGTGKVCGPMGVSTQKVCPVYSDQRLERVEQPSIVHPLCENACPNVEVVFREASGTATRVTFYDDPLCHREAEPGCEGSEQRCYYRVLAVTSELREERP